MSRCRPAPGVGAGGPYREGVRRFFYDTEFIEDGTTIDLVSIGVVDETGREFYAVSSQFDERKAIPWVRHALSAGGGSWSRTLRRTHGMALRSSNWVLTA